MLSILVTKLLFLKIKLNPQQMNLDHLDLVEAFNLVVEEEAEVEEEVEAEVEEEAEEEEELHTELK
jgi:hypothetical protein